MGFRGRYRLPNIEAAFERELENEAFTQGHKWQRHFWEHLIRDENDFERHVDYVHVNPVKHGLVTQVNQWPFSSLHRYVEKGIYPENWFGDLAITVTGMNNMRPITLR